MNREILFRGKRVDNGEWVYGCYLKERACDGVQHIIVDEDGEYYPINLKTRGQYTSLTDKNGKKIFEGDILDLTHYLLVDVGVVKFGEYKDIDMANDYPCGNVGFYVDIEKQRISVRKDILFFASECKVLGNVHDNPDLLKGEK